MPTHAPRAHRYAIGASAASSRVTRARAVRRVSAGPEAGPLASSAEGASGAARVSILMKGLALASADDETVQEATPIIARRGAAQEMPWVAPRRADPTPSARVGEQHPSAPHGACWPRSLLSIIAAHGSEL